MLHLDTRFGVVEEAVRSKSPYLATIECLHLCPSVTLYGKAHCRDKLPTTTMLPDKLPLLDLKDQADPME